MCRTSLQHQCYQRKPKQNDIEKKTTTEIRWKKNKKSSHDRSLRLRPIIYFIGKCQVILSLFGSSLLGFIHICNAMIHLLKVVRRFFHCFIAIRIDYIYLSCLNPKILSYVFSFSHFYTLFANCCRFHFTISINFTFIYVVENYVCAPILALINGNNEQQQQPTTIRKLLQASIRANKTGHFIWVASDRYFN